MKKYIFIFLAAIVLIYGSFNIAKSLGWVASTGTEVGLQLQGGTPGAIPFIGATGSLQQDYSTAASALNFQYTTAGAFSVPNIQFTSTAALNQTTGNIILGTGWGTTATVSLSTGSTDSTGTMTIVPNGAGTAANPTIQFKYNNGPYGKTFPLMAWTGSTNTTFPAPPIFTTSSTTMATATVEMTPINGITYNITYFMPH